MTTNYFLATTSTGKAHLVARGSRNATPCNSRNSGFRVRKVSATFAANISGEHFCAKCFPKGKPSDEDIRAMCE